MTKLKIKWPGFIIDDDDVLPPKVSTQKLKNLLEHVQKKFKEPTELVHYIVRINKDFSEIPRYMFYGRDQLSFDQINQYEHAIHGDFFLGVGWDLFTKIMRA